MNKNPPGAQTYVPPEVKPYEMAARIYLKKCGTDPDAEVPQAHPTLAGVVVKIPVWCFAAQELIDLSRKITAMREAHETPPAVMPS